MPINIEEAVPVVKQQGLNTAKSGTMSGVMSFTGANTHTGVETHTGAETHSGVETHSGAEDHTGAETFTGVLIAPQIFASGGDTLLANESGKTVIATAASGTQTFVLPAATVAGCEFTFICGHASGEILVDPAGTDDMLIKATNDAGASILNTDGTGIKNTAATNIIGDYITLVADGVGRWYCKAQSGIWGSQ